MAVKETAHVSPQSAVLLDGEAGEFLIYKLNMPFYFGGTSLLIVIGVGLDTAQQIESHMLMRNYEGFLAKGRLRGRSS